jgi:hypothetical protein
MDKIYRYKTEILFMAVLLLFGWYAARYIALTSFVVHGERYFVLFDDAMISMRYAHDLASGYGLVWNPGEFVEGYTNLLWTLYMALFHLLPIPASMVSLCIQISGAIFLGLNLVFVFKITQRLTTDMLPVLFAVVLTAFYEPLNTWSLLGMEVSIQALIISISIWIILAKLSVRVLPWLYLLLGVSTLVRVDMVVQFVLIFGFLLISDKQNQRSHLMWGLGSLALFIGIQEAFRIWYYGDWLPNTYYLKVENFPLALRVARGLWAFLPLVIQSNWILFSLPLLALIFRRDRTTILFVFMFLGQVGYSIYVGGDAWENRGGANRFIAIVMPIWFILLAYSINALRLLMLDKLKINTISAALISQIVMLGFMLMSIWNFNIFNADDTTIDRWLLRRKPVYVDSSERAVNTALIVENITTPRAEIAVTAAGTEPYFLPDRYVIDLLGKSDPVIAHGAVRLTLNLANVPNLRPGHMKWDYAYSIGKLQPDLIVNLWEDPRKDEEQFFENYVQGGADGIDYFYLRKDSPYILWDKVKLRSSTK